MFMCRKVIVLFLICSFVSTISHASIIQFQEGDSGKNITEIQVKLKEQGYYLKTIDGKFTNETTKAVINFQKGKKLKSDGIVDEHTYWALVGKPLLGNDDRRVSKVVKITDAALNLVGVPYKWGGVTSKGFDCSGLVWYVFDKNTVHLPRTADMQYLAGKAISRGNLQEGDLVFFTTYEPGASHNGIYLGKGKFVHASFSKGVMVSNLADSYWKTRYIGARRIV